VYKGENSQRLWEPTLGEFEFLKEVEEGFLEEVIYW